MAFSEKIFLFIHLFCFIAIAESSKHGLHRYHEDYGKIWGENISVKFIDFFEADATCVALIDIGREITSR